MVLLGVLSALLIAGLLVGGALAWWLAGRTLPRPRHLSRHGLDAQAAVWRHPAGRERWIQPDALPAHGLADGQVRRPPTGPDDDPDFISELERLIRGGDHGEQS
jgi:hypothetical protein